MDPLIGQTLGRYQILEVIGGGGMATVYKAYDPTTKRQVAIKVPLPYVAHDAGFRARFQHEMDLTPKLEYHYIVPIYDSGEDNGVPYIVMRYVDSGTLSDLIVGKDQRAVKLISQVAEALAYAHRQGVVHRDIKPTNILIDRDGNAMLTDFGIAKIFEETLKLTNDQASPGTPIYMAPEQILGEPVDARTDIYSLGVVLYQVVTGKSPFIADTNQAVMFMHINSPVRPPRQLNPAIPLALEQVIMRAMAKKPADRFQNADEMAKALQAALAGDADAISKAIQTGLMRAETASVKPLAASAQHGWLKLALPLAFVAIIGLVGWMVYAFFGSQGASGAGLGSLTTVPTNAQPATPATASTAPPASATSSSAAATEVMEPTVASAPSIGPTIQLPLTDPVQDDLPPIPSLFDAPPQPDQRVIVIQVDLSGAGKERGHDTLSALVFELDQRMNAMLPNLTNRVIVRYVDDKGNPDEAERVAEQVVRPENNVVAVVGLNRSATALRALVVYDREKVPTISVSATNKDLTNKAIYPNQAFRSMVASDNLHAMAAVEFMKKQLKVKKIRIIFVDNPYGRDLSQAVEAAAKQSGIDVGERIALPDTRPDQVIAETDQAITQAVAAVDQSVELVFFAGYYNQAIPLFQQLHEKNSALQLFGSDGVDHPDMRNAGRSIVGMYYTAIAAPSGEVIFNGVARVEFTQLAALAKRYIDATPGKAKVPTFLGESYDAMGLCLKLVQYAAQTLGAASRANTYRALGVLTDIGKPIAGVVGPYTYREDGTLENPVFYIRQYTGDDWSKNPILLKKRQ